MCTSLAPGSRRWIVSGANFEVGLAAPMALDWNVEVMG